MSRELPIVPIVHAFHWQCPKCEHDNFEKGVETPHDVLARAMQASVPEMTSPEAEQMASEEIGLWYFAPSVVECRNCRDRYKTKEDINA